jgi:hypothetical protein
VAVARLASTAMDCADPAALADFWAALVGGEVAYRSDEFCAVKTANGWLATVKVADYHAPTWPRDGVPKQMHSVSRHRSRTSRLPLRGAA